jgi:hypothetical protein
MANITFNCPHCNQAVQCDDQWGGQQIQCPLCQGGIIVPQAAPTASGSTGTQKNTLVPDVPTSATPKLSFQQNAQQPAAPRSVPIRKLAAPPPKKKNRLVTIGIWVGVAAALGAGVYFGWPLVRQYQEKLNEKTRAAEKDSDGGQVGHIADLNSVLDATDPSNVRLDKLAKRRKAGGPGEAPTPMAGDDAAPGAEPGRQAAAVPPTYTLDVTEAKFPDGAVNGSIAGKKFLPDNTRVDLVGAVPVLRLIQGVPTSPDREIMVYLRVKPGEMLANQGWTVASDQKAGSDVPLVYKRWQAAPGAPAAMKAFSSGYAMKLQLDKFADGAVSGKIFLALPDTEKSVVGGAFKATVAIPEGAAAALAPAAAATPAQPAERRSPDRYRTRNRGQ